MKASIVECPFGILAFNEENNIIGKILFPQKPQQAAEFIVKIESGDAKAEVAALISNLQENGYGTFVFENATLAKNVQSTLKADVEVLKHSAAGEFTRSNIEQIAVETGFIKNSEELSLWMHAVTLELAKSRVKGAVEKRDLQAGQAIQTIDELDKTINLLMSRAREWYGVHFPEFDRLMEKHETYARLIVNLGGRDNFTKEKLESEDIPTAKAEAISKTAQRSMGADLSDSDLKQIQSLSKNVLMLYSLRQNLESYLEETMKEVAPNVRVMVGSLLGARLISISGGLMNLARKPASTIQVLGAEKALFRSLKSGTRPPKHGMIFQHTLLHEAKRWQRGKMARALAGKLAIAARADAFGHRDISSDLKAGLDRRIDEIRQKYAEPPPMPEIRPRERKQERNEDRRKRRRER